jgi:Domain of unknown function (DUF6766)
MATNASTQAARKAPEGAFSLRDFISDYALSLTLFALFLSTWIGQFISQLIEFRNEAHAQEQEFQFWDFFPAFWQATLENWQSEFLQLFFFVVLTSFLIHRGSPESRDGTDEMQAKLDRIEKQLSELNRKSA